MPNTRRKTRNKNATAALQNENAELQRQLHVLSAKAIVRVGTNLPPYTQDRRSILGLGVYVRLLQPRWEGSVPQRRLHQNTA